MKPLKRAGNFRELRHGDPDGPSLVDARGKLPREDREAILSYLRSASALWWAACLFDDVLNPRGQGIDALGILTDGEWEWPTDLAYYVETYDVALPDELLAHMRANNWQPPQLTDSDLAQFHPASDAPAQQD